ncbi:MAG: QueT transporter family protein [Bacilli bacterium]|nr:QueT transporter family protein [Bacilli bacterium]
MGNKGKMIDTIARNGIIAGLYAALTLVCYPFAYGMIQFRISEFLVLLCFFRKDYTFGLTLGCALANLFSPQLFLWDVLIGTSATLIACLGICFCKHLVVACAMPIVANAVLVGLELSVILEIESFIVCAAFVALGELVAMIVGYVLFVVLKKRQGFYNAIKATQNMEFKF